MANRNVGVLVSNIFGILLYHA